MSELARTQRVLDVGMMGWVDRLLIAVWKGSSLQAADAFYEEMKRGFEQFRSGVGHLAIIEPKSPVPPTEARKRISQAFDEYPEAAAAVAVVFEGSGFFASAVGSVASGIMYLTGRKTPFKLCTNVPEAALFLAQYVEIDGEPVTPGICRRAISQLRAELAEPPRTSVPPAGR